MAPTPSCRPSKEQMTPMRTPQAKHRLHFSGMKNPRSAVNPSPLPAGRENGGLLAEHPVEVVGRIRDHPDRSRGEKKLLPSALEISPEGTLVRVRTETGHRDFSLDGVSVAGDGEDLEGFYKRFVKTRITGVKSGGKCTIMMYGPTGSGKSHTMFGCAKQPGIVYRALRDILREKEDGDDGGVIFVQVAVLEIYNEEIYDLLPGTNGAGPNGGFPKGSTPKVSAIRVWRSLQNS